MVLELGAYEYLKIVIIFTTEGSSSCDFIVDAIKSWSMSVKLLGFLPWHITTTQITVSDEISVYLLEPNASTLYSNHFCLQSKRLTSSAWCSCHNGKLRPKLTDLLRRTVMKVKNNCSINNVPRLMYATL